MISTSPLIFRMKKTSRVTPGFGLAIDGIEIFAGSLTGFHAPKRWTIEERLHDFGGIDVMLDNVLLFEFFQAR